MSWIALGMTSGIPLIVRSFHAMGWKSGYSFDEALEETISWYAGTNGGGDH